MSTSTLPRTRGPVRDGRTLRRIAAALIMPLPALAIATQPLYRPGYDTLETGATLDAVAANPGAQTLFVWTGALAMLTLVPAFLAAARLARRRRPLLATWAAGVNLVAYLGAGLGFAGLDVVTEVAARSDLDRPTMVAFIDGYSTHGVFNVGVGLFVIGHIVGAVLLGLALRGTVPGWASIAMIASQPLHFVAFVVLQSRYLDAASWGLTALALTVCAVTVLRTSNDEWDLPAARA